MRFFVPRVQGLTSSWPEGSPGDWGLPSANNPRVVRDQFPFRACNWGWPSEKCPRADGADLSTWGEETAGGPKKNVEVAGARLVERMKDSTPKIRRALVTFCQCAESNWGWASSFRWPEESTTGAKIFVTKANVPKRTVLSLNVARDVTFRRLAEDNGRRTARHLRPARSRAFC